MLVKICLILNYLGQGAWLLANQNSASLATVEDMNPFFLMVPETFRVGMVIIGTLAAIIASQALITGAFTLVSEASRLDLMPHLQIIYPSSTKGQLYIPLVNYSLWISCILVVLYFKTSAHMEAAYGLSITITMLMTTLLLFEYLRKIKKRHFTPYLFLLFFGGLEGAFFLSSLRLDKVIASMFKVSRQVASEAIRAGNCKVNYKVVEEVSFLCHNNDMISLKHYGRVKISIENRQTKQGNEVVIGYFYNFACVATIDKL